MCSGKTCSSISEGGFVVPLDLAGLEPPVTLRTAVPLTDDELMRFSEESKPYKIERNREGEILVMTPVGYTGSQNELYIAASLLHWAEEDGKGSAAGPNAGFNLPDGSCLAPDAAWTSLERIDALTDKQRAGYPPLCPEFIIEVRSRTDSRRLLEAKMQLWLDNGAQLAWLVDPLDASVTVYHPGEEPVTLSRPDVLRGEAPVDGFELKCERLWRNVG